MKTLALGLMIQLVYHAAADSPKRGQPICTLGDCGLKEIPNLSSFDKEAKKSNASHRLLEDQNIPLEKEIKLPVIPKKVTFKKRPKLTRPPLEQPQEVGNLPAFYRHVDRSNFQSSSDNEFDVAQAIGAKLPGLRSGDLVHAVIDQSIKASPSVPTPIRAMIIQGPFKGCFFLGAATLDRELKRVLLQFTRLRRPGTDQVYQAQATGLSLNGQVGLEGNYESQAGKFFVAEFAAGAVAGFADATTQRSQTSFGTYVTEPSLANAGKQAGVNALGKTAERFADQARSAPEWTELTGYQEIQVIIESDPTEILN